MIDYAHAKTVVFPEGPAKAKIKRVACRKRRDPDDWPKKVDTVVIELAVIHYTGLKNVTEDVIPITRKRGLRIDQLRIALGEELPADDDRARWEWDEQTAVGKELYLRFSSWKTEKGKTVNLIEYLTPDNGEVFEEAKKEVEPGAEKKTGVSFT